MTRRQPNLSRRQRGDVGPQDRALMADFLAADRDFASLHTNFARMHSGRDVPFHLSEEIVDLHLDHIARLPGR